MVPTNQYPTARLFPVPFSRTYGGSLLILPAVYVYLVAKPLSKKEWQCSSLSKSSLQAWTSTIALDVYPEGPVHTQRLDILVGTGHGHSGTATVRVIQFAACCVFLKRMR